jgi:mannose-1-phosphate guanylyltransferase
LKAFLLAGGHGTRLRPLTDSTPKCLLRGQGMPLWEIWFALSWHHGIDEALINVHAHGDALRKFIEKNKEGLKVRLSEETTLLGSAGAIHANRDWGTKEKSFWILYADVRTTANLDKRLPFHDCRGQIATIGVYEVADSSRCGIVQVDEGSVLHDFVEKPHAPVGNLAFSGLILASPALLDAIPDTCPVDLGFHVLPQIAGRMAACRIPGLLIDIGTIETY